MVLDYIKESFEIQIDEKAIKFYHRGDSLVDDLHVDDLKLSVRTTNCLLRNKIEFTSQILKIKYNDLKELRGLGEKSFNELIKKLKEVSYLPRVNDINVQLSSNPNIGLITDIIVDDLISHCTTLEITRLRTTISHLICMFIKSLDLSNGITDNDVLDWLANEDFLSNVYMNEYIKKNIVSDICRSLEGKYHYISLRLFQKKLPELIRSTFILTKYIDIFRNCLLLDWKDNEVRYKYPSIDEYIESLDNNNAKYILSKRLEGKTLENIGIDLNLTRSRVGQISVKYFNKRPSVKEDEYREYFEKYDLTKEQFINTFHIKEKTYNYLLNTCTKGNVSIEEFIDDESLSYEIRQRAEKEMYKNFLMIDGQYIKLNRKELSRYVIKKYFKYEGSVEQFEEKYNQFLEEYDLISENKYFFTSRSLEGNLPNYNFLLWKLGKKLRYYDFEDYDLNFFVQQLQLNQYENQEFSTLKLMRDNAELMKEYDIQDEYELHNLLKKLPIEWFPKNIKFLRMPNLSIGEADRDMQVLNLLIQLAPISNTELGEAFENEYGIKKETAMGYMFSCIDEYYHNGMYTINQNTLDLEEYTMMQEDLSEDFYFIEDIKNIYLEKFPNGDVKKINTYTLKTLGFKPNISYIYRNHYVSSDAYFKNFIMQHEIIDLNYIDRRITRLNSFYSVLNELRKSLQILEFKPNQFINYNRLEQAGITKELLQDYNEKVLEYVGDTYFTVYYLSELGFTHELDDLGFEDCFYASLIGTNEKIKIRRLGQSILLKKSSQPISLSDFFETLLSHFRKIDIYDLLYYLKDTYGLSFDRLKVIDIIKQSNLYYDTIMEKVYIDYDEYFEEV